MAIELVKFKDIPPYEIFEYRGMRGCRSVVSFETLGHHYDSRTCYYMMLPNGMLHSLGSGECEKVEYPDFVEEIYTLKTDEDYTVASSNLLNSEWIYTQYDKVPSVNPKSTKRDLFLLHYRITIYGSGNITDQYQTLFNVAVRATGSTFTINKIDNWYIYNESDRSWSTVYKFNREISIIGWSSIPYQVYLGKIGKIEIL